MAHFLMTQQLLVGSIHCPGSVCLCSSGLCLGVGWSWWGAVSLAPECLPSLGVLRVSAISLGLGSGRLFL